MQVLVTGATGFTGGRLAEMLCARGEDVVALARPTADTARLERLGAKIITGDIRSAEDVRRAAEGCEHIYHVAALYRSAKHADSVYEEVNVGGTSNVLDAARALGTERVVHCSTVGVHGDVPNLPVDEDAPYAPGDIYQITKLAGEMKAQSAIEDGLPVTIARPAGIYGPGDMRFHKLFSTIQSGKFRMIGTGEVVYHFTYVDDVCRGLMACADTANEPGGTYIICGKDFHPLTEVVRIASDCVGTPLRRGSIPVGPVMLAATICEGVCKPLGVEPPLFRRRLDFFTKNRAFDGSKAERELGFVPQVPLEEGFRRTAAWYFENGHLSGPAPAGLTEELAAV